MIFRVRWMMKKTAFCPSDMDRLPKPCIACGVVKPWSEFYPHPAMRDGTLNRCKPCLRKCVQEARVRNRENYLQYDRDRYEKGKPERLAIIQTGIEKRPERNRARFTLHNAVKRGHIIKPEFCDDCGQHFERRAIHGHHDDYTKPLEVAWLCAPCHGKRHRMEQVA